MQGRRLGVQLDLGLWRHLGIQPVPRPGPDEVLQQGRERLRRVRGRLDRPARGCVPEGGRRRGQDGRGPVPGEGEGDWVQEGLCVPGRLRALLRQGD